MCCWQCGGRSEPWIAPVCCHLAPTSCSDHRRSSLRLVTKQWLPRCHWKNKALISAMDKKGHATKKWRWKCDERQADQCLFAQHGSCKLKFQNWYVDKIWLSLSVFSITVSVIWIVQITKFTSSVNLWIILYSNNIFCALFLQIGSHSSSKSKEFQRTRNQNVKKKPQKTDPLTKKQANNRTDNSVTHTKKAFHQQQ